MSQRRLLLASQNLTTPVPSFLPLPQARPESRLLSRFPRSQTRRHLRILPLQLAIPHIPRHTQHRQPPFCLDNCVNDTADSPIAACSFPIATTSLPSCACHAVGRRESADSSIIFPGRERKITRNLLNRRSVGRHYNVVVRSIGIPIGSALEHLLHSAHTLPTR